MTGNNKKLNQIFINFNFKYKILNSISFKYKLNLGYKYFNNNFLY